MATEGTNKDYIRPMPKRWWATRPTWRRFIIRELTSVFVAAYCLFLICMVVQAGDDASWARLIAYLKSPWSVLFHVAVLLMVLYHTITWFAAAPKALRVYRGDERVPEHLVAGAHFAAWIVVSIIVAWIVLR